MSVLGCLRLGLLAAAAMVATHPAAVSAQTASAPPAAAQTPPAAERDGSHDFDFMIGTWKVWVKRLVKPLTGSTTWVEFEGRDVVTKVWDGKANLSEFTVHNAENKSSIQGVTLRLYNPKSRQWHLYWGNSANGTIGVPTVGQFTNGRGEFYDQEEWEGRMIFVRYVWSDITPTSAKFEQSFSIDGGKTWEPNWISTITRDTP